MYGLLTMGIPNYINKLSALQSKAVTSALTASKTKSMLDHKGGWKLQAKY